MSQVCTTKMDHISTVLLFWTTIRPGYNCQSLRDTKLLDAYRQCYVFLKIEIIPILICYFKEDLNTKHLAKYLLFILTLRSLKGAKSL
ncbi:unnamed protein product [Lasius platythorax]|uniref:Uncharacterized protein n=1 Tax=Lasius platythorax TaxID=488582 RepID=A0AAV2NYG0_9HYME